MPAEPVERHILKRIESSVVRLRDSGQLRQALDDELRRVYGNVVDARERLQRRLAECDQRVAKLRDHLKALDHATAQALGLYDDAKALADERSGIERELAHAPSMPALPDLAELRRQARTAWDRLQGVIESGSIEERRTLVQHYVHKVVTDPGRQVVTIHLLPPLVSQIVTGEGLEPSTNGLKGRCSTD